MTAAAEGGHLRAQRLAYDAAIEVARDLEPGVTERQAAKRLDTAIAARGVSQYFHQPFAWFGERTRLDFGQVSPRFFPTGTRLEQGAVGILDVAPVVDGFVADIGYTFRCGGPDDALRRALATLRQVRAIIPQRVASGHTMRAIYAEVDELFASAGYQNRHARYPFGVLGHRVGELRAREREPRIAGFGLTAGLALLVNEVRSRLPGSRASSPLWTGGRAADRSPAPGLWAIEPHLGAHGFGAKFEEILVVDRDGARWLDAQPPAHLEAAED